MRAYIAATAAVFTLTIGRASAQRGAQSIPAPRPLGPIVARTRSYPSVGGLLTVRGAVFIQDSRSRQLWMLDTALANPRIVLDSTTGLGKENFYGPEIMGGRGGGGGDGTMFRFRGDSITYQAWIPIGANGAQLSPEALVIGPNGRVARVTATPSINCEPEVENSGFFTCEVNLPLTRDPPVDMGDSVMTRARGDSAILLSVNYTTWDTDTIPVRLATVPRTQITMAFRPRGARTTIQSPVLATSDSWVTFRDGTLAIVRGVDYHVDIVDVRGNVIRGPRAPYDWRRVTDDDRDRLVDSMRRADSVMQKRADSLAASRPPRIGPDGNPLPLLPARGAQDRARPDEWSTYWPPLRGLNNSTRTAPVLADEDGRIWVPERQPVGGDTITVYGIFDKKGQFLERVKVPATMTVRAFGPGGTVYLTTVDAGRTTVLKARFK